MNADFTRIAHRRTVWAELQRLLLEQYVNSEQPARSQMICEEVPFSQKEVSQEALMEVLEELERIQNDERLEMAQFELRRRDARPVRQQESQEESVEEPVRKKKRNSDVPPHPGKKPEAAGAGDPARAPGRQTG